MASRKIQVLKIDASVLSMYYVMSQSKQLHSKLQRFKNKSSKIVISDQSKLRSKYKS